MDQKPVGAIIAIIGILLILISISFTMEHMAFGMELHKTCDLADAVCPFIAVPWQGMFSIGIGVLFVIVGIAIYMKPFASRKRHHNIDMDSAKKALKELEGDERDVMNSVIGENGMIFQSALMERTGLSKVKITRVLDRLENKRLIERKRRGMTNVVVLR